MVTEVEQAFFTPLVFATTGGMGREAMVFYCCLADHLSRRSSASSGFYPLHIIFFFA